MTEKIHAVICAISLCGLIMPVYGIQPSVNFDQMNFSMGEIMEQLGNEPSVLPVSYLAEADYAGPTPEITKLSFMGFGRTNEKDLIRLREEFSQASAIIPESVFEDSARKWTCKLYDISYKKKVFESKNTFENYVDDNQRRAIYMIRDNFQFPFGPFIFSDDNEYKEWEYPRAFLRMVDDKTMILERNDRPNGLGGAYRQISCKSKKDCFFADSIVTENLIVLGYEVCTR